MILAGFPELAIMGTKWAKVKPDGTLKNALRLDYGYWVCIKRRFNLRLK